MSFKKWPTLAFIFLFVFVLRSDIGANGEPASLEPGTIQLKAPEIALITAEELKAKLARNEPVAIIDVRATSSFADSDNQIKGAIHVKLRRLKYRLGFPPLKNIPLDREILTYCACPADESALSAAQVLMGSGFKRVRALKGGWNAWLKGRGQVERLPKGI